MIFTPSGDKELWVFKSEVVDIPLICTPSTDPDGYKFWVIVRAVYVNYGLRAGLDLVLNPLSVIREHDRWIIPQDKFPDCIAKCLGITPEYYFRYDEKSFKDVPIEVEVSEESPKHDESFLREVWGRTRIGQFGTFKVVWASLVDGIAHQLLIEQKPVDLGWFVLHALPFRANWKHNLLSKHPKLKVFFNSLSDSQRKVALKIHGVETDIFRTDNMAVATQGSKFTFRWNVEVECKQEWWKYMDKVELQRLTTATSDSYLHRWATIVKRSQKVIYALLRQFTDQMARPAGQPLLLGDGRRRRLAPYIPPQGGRPRDLDRVDCPLVVDDGSDQVRAPEDKVSARKQVKEMPSLPVLRLTKKDLRNSRGDMEYTEGA